MSISFMPDKMTEHDKLNRDEAIIFCLFLLSEMDRHAQDISMLSERIIQMERKHNFNANDEYEKRQ